jgi:hypothetical protein
MQSTIIHHSKMSGTMFAVVTGNSCQIWSRSRYVVLLETENQDLVLVFNGNIPITVASTYLPGLMKSSYTKVVDTINISQLYKYVDVIASRGCYNDCKEAKAVCGRLKPLLFKWAASRIQRVWRKYALRNPNLKACQRRLMEEFELMILEM